MGLEYAIDELYSSGWGTLDTTGCQFGPDGRVFPGMERIAREFRQDVCELEIMEVPEFGCFCAEWLQNGEKAGSVVSETAHEAAVYALARHRRSRTPVATA